MVQQGGFCTMNWTKGLTRNGFALIELFVVIAIIALLTVVALPRFRDAQRRSAVSRVEADLRTCAAALEAYQADYLKYPYDGYSLFGPPIGFNFWFLSRMLSTPVAYLENVNFPDPFGIGFAGTWQILDYRYTSMGSTYGTDWTVYSGVSTPSPYLDDVTAEFGGWRLASVGPDKLYGPYGWPGLSTRSPYSFSASALQMPYDPTNGLVSVGDIIRSHNCINGYLPVQ
jgi:prepilin-type N-terminal cleavage/methylation domain-containing protein